MPKIAYVGSFLPFLDPLHTIKTFWGRFPCKIAHKIAHSISCKIFPQEFQARFSRNNFQQDFATIISLKIFPHYFPARFSCKNFPEDFSTRSSHKIFPQDFPTKFSHKIFPQEFPTRFSCRKIPARFFPRFSCKIFPQEFSKLNPDWLAPDHPIPNAKIPPITALLNMPIYHKSAKVSQPPFAQILWEPRISQLLTDSHI